MRGILCAVVFSAAIVLSFIAAVSARPLQVDFFGDSTTAGAQTVGGKLQLSEFSEPVLVHAGLRSHFGKDVVVNNFGIGGTQAVELLRGQMGYEKPWLERMMYSKADIIVLNFSWNDKQYYFFPVEGREAVSPTQFAAVLSELIFIAKWAGKEVVLQDPNPGDFDFSKSDKLQQYISAIHKVSVEKNTPLVDNFEYIMKIPDWRTYLSEDKIHPSDALYGIKAKRSLEIILPLARQIEKRKTNENLKLKLKIDKLVFYCAYALPSLAEMASLPLALKLAMITKNFASAIAEY